jgi:hypothetical protein
MFIKPQTMKLIPALLTASLLAPIPALAGEVILSRTPASCKITFIDQDRSKPCKTVSILKGVKTYVSFRIDEEGENGHGIAWAIEDDVVKDKDGMRTYYSYWLAVSAGENLNSAQERSLCWIGPNRIACLTDSNVFAEADF